MVRKGSVVILITIAVVALVGLSMVMLGSQESGPQVYSGITGAATTEDGAACSLRCFGTCTNPDKPGSLSGIAAVPVICGNCEDILDKMEICEEDLDTACANNQINPGFTEFVEVVPPIDSEAAERDDCIGCIDREDCGDQITKEVRGECSDPGHSPRKCGDACLCDEPDDAEASPSPCPQDNAIEITCNIGCRDSSSDGENSGDDEGAEPLVVFKPSLEYERSICRGNAMDSDCPSQEIQSELCSGAVGESECRNKHGDLTEVESVGIRVSKTSCMAVSRTTSEPSGVKCPCPTPKPTTP